jgi:threonine dehydratase
MPEDAPRSKIEGTRRLGANIVFYDRYRESREEIATHLARKRQATLVPSFDDYDVIAGQGTVGLEIIEDAQAKSVELDAVLVCCGGGGLVAGTATAIKALRESVAVFSVEPEGFDDTARSLAAGERVSVDPAARSICDALLTPIPGELTFPINLALLDGGLVVSDEEVRSAMAFAFAHLKLVLEPGGAVALAAVLAGKVPTQGRQMAIVLSGGNVDPELASDVINPG